MDTNWGVLDGECILLLPRTRLMRQHRLASTPRSHIEALAFIVANSPGAARSLASEIIPVCSIFLTAADNQTIEACPTTQPPENLFTNLSSSPALLACIAAHCPPATFLDLATSSLIDKSDDTGVRSEDPQGSMTRFGEGVVLVETFATQYKVVFGHSALAGH
jgi:mediator of RNA polymerase II transcription subunit 5